MPGNTRHSWLSPLKKGKIITHNVIALSTAIGKVHLQVWRNLSGDGFQVAVV